MPKYIDKIPLFGKILGNSANENKPHMVDRDSNVFISMYKNGDFIWYLKSFKYIGIFIPKEKYRSKYFKVILNK